MMKFLFNCLFSIFFLFTTSTYSAEKYDGPTSLEAAKERFFQNRQLSNIEGIWYHEDENAYYAITKRDNTTFNKWTISHKIPKYIGTLDISGNILKTATPNIFIYKTTVYNINNPTEEFTASATMLLEGNLISYQIKSFRDNTGKRWSFNEANLFKIWPTAAEIKNNKDTSTDLNEKVFFNGDYYKKKISTDYKTKSGGKRDCTEFYSTKYYYYICESSSRISFSKEFLQNENYYGVNDLLRYTSFKNENNDVAFKGLREYENNHIIISGGWIDDQRVYYGVRDDKYKKWIAYYEDGHSYLSDTGLTNSEVKKLINNSKKHYSDAIQVKNDLEQLLGKKYNQLTQKVNPLENNKTRDQIDYKSYWWVVILIGVIAFFVYTQTTKELPKPKKIQKFKPKNQGAIGKFFEGDVSLATSFWGIYFGLGTAIGLIYYGLSENSDNYLIIVLSSLFVVSFTVFTMIGTWRSASKYKIDKKRKGDRGGWGTAAQVYIALGVIRMISQFIRALG